MFRSLAMRFSLAVLILSLARSFAHAAGESEPVVHLLVPGFTVQELPVKLGNINNLRFAPDGRLTALGYDGRVHLLRDTDSDGLEDRDELFWDQPTLSVPVGMAWSKEGLYVSSHGKISLLRDLNGDGRADVENVITTNWPPTDVASGGVDATAITLDERGNIYFGLLTADYANPYRVKDDVSHYDLHGKRGTIQKLSSDGKKMETIATGIRVPYTLAFNRHGDLFVTDQEGETWCPNGNPLDEINHIIPGRNYGFPPRHEKWLPDLVSEPPTVAFGPQHQSTCGLVFNEPHPRNSHRAGQGLFGPKWWEGDALVAGESRGKIWRVRLVKTSQGYVGKAFLIARLSMLTMDVAISPKGDLYVCCHSGLPDWGTGPRGEGKIFKISYTDSQAPQPVAVWPELRASRPDGSVATDLRVAFDRPVDSSVTNRAADMRLEFGDFVSAADRFELLKPPYEVVKRQEASPREALKVRAARLENGNRLLVLDTEPIARAAPHALTIPGVQRLGRNGASYTVDLDFDLHGAQTSFRAGPLATNPANRTGQNDKAVPRLGSGSLLHPALSITEKFLQPFGRTPQPWLDPALGKPGVLRVWARLNLPVEAASFRVSAAKTFRFEAPGRINQPARRSDGRFVSELDLLTTPHDAWFAVEAETSSLPLSFIYTLKGDAIERPMSFRHFRYEWAPTNAPPPAMPTQTYELAGGDYERGRELFFGERLKCATCHRIRGEGGTVGPDLGHLISRDAGSVLRDIKEPSASINPDFVAYNVSWREGELTGFIRAQDELALHIVGADSKERVIPRAAIQELRVSSLSLMPTGLLDGIGEGQVRDLLTFLLHAPPERTREEVQTALGPGSAPPTSGDRPLNIVLVAGKQDHGPGQHDYPAWQKKWHALLEGAPRVQISDAWEWPGAQQFQTANLILFYFWNHDWNADRYRQLDDFLARGGGVVLLHSATIADKGPEQLAARIGLSAQPGPTKYLHAPIELKILAPANHAITRNLPTSIRFLDEPYWPMFGDTNKIEVLATTQQEGKEWPMMWTFRSGQGRVFASILGHYSWTLDDPLFQILILRGIAWAGDADPVKFETLARPR
jgi:putative heme-binding domain-containing protein